MKAREIRAHLEFLYRTTESAARSVKKTLLPRITEAYEELIKILDQREAEEEAREAQLERLAKL